MKKKTVFEVWLANNDCIFDFATGFRTPKTALKWAKGRGGEYSVYISASDKPIKGINFRIDNRTRRNRYYLWNICEWQELTEAEIVDLLK